jgi:hypothetical protein
VRAHAAGRAEPPKPSSQEILLWIATGFWVAQQVRDCSTISSFCSLSDYFPAASDWSATTSRWTERLEYDYFSVDATALRTSSCINCERLHRTTHHDEWWEWSRWCLRHWPLHRVYLHVPLFISLRENLK